MIGSPTSSPLSLARSLKSPKLMMPLPLPGEGESPGMSPITPGGIGLGLGSSFNGAAASLGAGNTNEAMDAPVVDGALPPLRDVRKFMRRCPKLVVLGECRWPIVVPGIDSWGRVVRAHRARSVGCTSRGCQERSRDQG